MDMLQVDLLAYENPGRQRQPRARQLNAQALKGDLGKREADICLNCPIPGDCQSESVACPIRPVMGNGGNRKKGNCRVVPAVRRRLVLQHGASIQSHLRQHGPSTCPDIAAAIGCQEGDIYTAMASLILEVGEPIKPCGMRGKAALYQLTTDTATDTQTRKTA